MNTHMRRNLFIFFLILGISSIPCFSTTIIFVQPPTTTVAPGQSFSLDIAMSRASGLYGYQFDLKFDPTLLQVTSVVPGTYFPAKSSIFIPGAIDNVAGSVNATASTLTGPVLVASGDGILATFNFSALAEGTSQVDLLNLILLDSNLNNIPADIANGSVTVTNTPALPEPASMLMLATGFAALARRAKRT